MKDMRKTAIKGRIFLTGATGFLGSHIARKLAESGYHLMLSYRDQSNFTRCADFKDQSEWINLSHDNWKPEIEKFSPEIIMNIAWQGVESDARENRRIQIENIFFQQELLEVAEKVRAKTFIGFGSQAEYGNTDEPANETDPTNPTTAYGAAKLAALQMLQAFCTKYTINWIWLRLFSFFGEGESDKWLIPSVIKKIKENNRLELTPGEQQIAYIYVKDLSAIIASIINTKPLTGIYNISGNQLISVKELVIKIRDLINPEYELNFGTIPYRKEQPMRIIGNTDKIKNALSFIYESDFNTNLKNVVNYYLKQV
jgi:nucleoside-diphosphate-sugar epimerase